MNKSSREFLDATQIEEIQDEAPDLEDQDSVAANFTPSVLASNNASPAKLGKLKPQKIKTRKRSE